MGNRFSEEQIFGCLREEEAGMPIKDLYRRHGIRIFRPVVASGGSSRRKSKFSESQIVEILKQAAAVFGQRT